MGSAAAACKFLVHRQRARGHPGHGRACSCSARSPWGHRPAASGRVIGISQCQWRMRETALCSAETVRVGLETKKKTPLHARRRHLGEVQRRVVEGATALVRRHGQQAARPWRSAEILGLGAGGIEPPDGRRARPQWPMTPSTPASGLALRPVGGP